MPTQFAPPRSGFSTMSEPGLNCDQRVKVSTRRVRNPAFPARRD
jgi:hypothetical protein